MSLPLAWNNVLAYSLQIGLLVGVAAFVPSLLRLGTPRARLLYWRLLLVACLLLPALRPWKRGMIAATVQVTTTVLALQPAGAPHRGIPIPQLALTLLAAGFLLRVAWLCAGFWRLRQYRRRSVALYPPSTWEVEARLRLSHSVASPVTFGFRRPVVLLPANFPELPESVREAVLCHEILHVRRGDWLFTVGEELVRAVFWFHPAIWWLLGEIQLAREQAVDRQVIEVTKSRDEYVDALLAIAGARPRLDLAPAPLFLRKRHLKQRVVSLFTEARVSQAWLVSALSAGLAILALECWWVTAAFPLAAATQSDPPPRPPAPIAVVQPPAFLPAVPVPAVRRGAAARRPFREPPVARARPPAAPVSEPEAPPLEPAAPLRIRVGGNVQQTKLVSQPHPIYPPLAKQARIQGVVHLQAVIGKDGAVQDLQVLSGHPLLLQSALEAVRRWVYEPTFLNGQPVEVVTRIDVNFTLTQ